MNSIKSALQCIVRRMKFATVLMGTVVSLSPLTVKVAGDEKLALGPDALCVPRHLTDHTVRAEIAAEEENVITLRIQQSPVRQEYHIQKMSARVTIRGALKKGDMVYMLRYGEGRKYYILDRMADV